MEMWETQNAVYRMRYRLVGDGKVGQYSRREGVATSNQTNSGCVFSESSKECLQFRVLFSVYYTRE